MTERAVERPDREEILRRGREAFKAKLKAERRELEHRLVGTFFVFPMTLAEKQTIFEDFQDKKLLSLARMVVVRAKNEDGSRIFAKADALTLVNEWSSEDVEEVATLVQSDEEDELAQAIELGEGESSGN